MPAITLASVLLIYDNHPKKIWTYSLSREIFSGRSK